MEPGESELEQYTTFSTSKVENMKGNTSTELNFELEIGMTKNFDFAVYQTFKQGSNGQLNYDGYKLRARYKIGQKNQFFLDPLIYLEYEGKPDFSEHVIEPKLILAKEIGDFTFSLNPYVEIEKPDLGEWEFTPKYSFGGTYSVSNLFKAGLEFIGSEHGNYIGPTISHGAPKVWVAFGLLTKIGNIDLGQPNFKLRFIMGVNL